MYKKIKMAHETCSFCRSKKQPIVMSREKVVNRNRTMMYRAECPDCAVAAQYATGMDAALQKWDLFCRLSRNRMRNSFATPKSNEPGCLDGVEKMTTTRIVSEILKHSELSLKGMADALGVSLTTIDHLKKGERYTPKVRILIGAGEIAGYRLVLTNGSKSVEVIREEDDCAAN